MLKKILPLFFLFIGLAGGIGAAMFIPMGDEPNEETAASDHAKDGAAAHSSKPAKKDYASDHSEKTSEYIKLHNQFIVPVIHHDEVAALVVMSLSVEAEPGLSETLYASEPKLRDAFLQTLFDHANLGGFDGAFTSATALKPLRAALRDAARKELGDAVINVLITDLARQDT
jgi:hypothetical protein